MTQIGKLLDELTDRERDILHGLSLGLSNAEIAERYTLSPSTVKWYTRQIYSKLQLDQESDKRQAAATLAQQAGISTVITPANHLPVDVTPFIGRTEEIAALCELLREPFPRLITIVGLGGSGKTRLATQVARELASDFKDHIYFVLLQNVYTRDELMATIARQIGCTDNHKSHDWLKTIARYLGDHQTLLVLDNTEQLFDSASILVDLLQMVPNLHLLVTSRRQLDLNSESIFPLGGMSYPVDDTQSDLLSYDAINYFVSKLKQANLRWQVGEADLEHIVQICRLVDGLPLALTIASRWFPRLSLASIRSHIIENAENLSTNVTDIPPRQHSIQAVLRWMNNALSIRQREQFAYLGLFSGYFALDAAEFIAGMTQLELKNFNQLCIVDVVRPELFKLHPLVQQFALKQLNTSNQYDEAQRRFVRYYVSFATGISTQLVHRVAALDTFEEQWTHIRSAWQFALALEDWDNLNDLLMPVHHFAWRRNYFREASLLYEDALRNMSIEHTQLRAEITVCAIHLTTWSSPITQSLIDDVQSAITTLRTNLDHTPLAFAHIVYSLLLRETGQYHAAYDAANQALMIYEACGNTWGQTIALYQIGLSKNYLNAVQDALAYWQRCRELNISVGDAMLEGTVLHRMAGIEWRSGKNNRALNLLEQAHKITASLGDREIIGGITQLTSLVYFSQGAFDAAAHYRETSLQYYKWAQDERTTRYLLTQEVYTALIHHNLKRAQIVMDEIGHDLDEAPVATCVDHLRYACDATVPDPATVLTRIKELNSYHAFLEMILSASLLLVPLAERGLYQNVMELGANLMQSPACPTWLITLPAPHTAFESAKAHFGYSQFQSLWHRLATRTPILDQRFIEQMSSVMTY